MLTLIKNHYVLIGASWITSTFNKVWRVSLHKDECEDAEHIDVGNQLKGWSHAINFPDLALVSIDGAVVLLKGLQVLSNINLGFTAIASVIALGGSEVILEGQDAKLHIHFLSTDLEAIVWACVSKKVKMNNMLHHTSCINCLVVAILDIVSTIATGLISILEDKDALKGWVMLQGRIRLKKKTGL